MFCFQQYDTAVLMIIAFLPSAVQVLRNDASDRAPSYDKCRQYFRTCFERPVKNQFY